MTFEFSMSLKSEGQCRLTLKASLGSGIKGRQDVQSCSTGGHHTRPKSDRNPIFLFGPVIRCLAHNMGHLITLATSVTVSLLVLVYTHDTVAGAFEPISFPLSLKLSHRQALSISGPLISRSATS